MRWLKIILGLIGVYILLLLLVPKGNVIHEILRIPEYQFYVQRQACDNMDISTHRYGDQRRQYLIHCKSKQHIPNNKPVIIYYHGGGWAFGTPEIFRTNAQFFVDRGFEVFMPSYRRIPQYRYPAIRADISNALELVIEIMDQSEFKNRKIILGGMSAGGNLVALTLYDRAELNNLGIDQSRFAGLMLFGAPLDLQKMAATPVRWSYAGSEQSATFKQASPITHLQTNEKTPVLCVHGTHDGLVAYASTLSYLDKMEKINPDLVTFYSIEKGTHLNSGSWNFEDNEIRKTLENWLDKINSE